MKAWMIVALVLILVGGLVFLLAMAKSDWDFQKLSTEKYTENTHIVTDPFDSLSLLVETADVSFLRSDDGLCRVVCLESARLTHTVQVINGCLTVKVNDARAWYDHVGITLGGPKITVYLPEAAYSSLTAEVVTGDISLPAELGWASVSITTTTGDIDCRSSVSGEISLSCTTGDITLSSLTAAKLSLTTTTGNITAASLSINGDISMNATTGDMVLTDISCRAFSSAATTGRLALTELTATAALTVERETGNITLARCDGASLSIKTTTGHVSGSLASEKLFLTETDTGRVSVPRSTAGGICDIKTTTGDISITVE